MVIMKRRIVFSDNGTHRDFTTSLGDYKTGQETVSIINSEDTLFIGSYLPFNHFYLKLGDRVNDQVSTMRINLWDGRQWVDVAQVFDSTSTALCSLGQSGYVEFVPRKENGWLRDDTIYQNGNQKITGLGTSVIYEQFWLAISFSASLTSNVHLKWLGQKFSNDTDLAGEYPDLARTAVIQAIDSTKTDYEEQHVWAADIIVKDLTLKNIILSPDQILYREDLRFASVSQVAKLIYNMLGDDYRDNKTDANNEYKERLNTAAPKIDTNLDGRLDNVEVFPTSGRLFR